MASPKSASRSALLPFRADHIAPGPDRVVETADAHIDRRQHFPGAPVFGIAGEVILDLGDHVLDIAGLARRLQPRRQRFARQVGRAEREVERDGADRQQNETGDGGDAAAQQRRRFRRRLFGFRGIGGGNQPARHLDAGGLGFGVADQPGGTVALNFVQLVAVDGDVAARTQGFAARQRPQHGEDGRRRHQCKHEPECHRTIYPLNRWNCGQKRQFKAEKTSE